MHCSILIFLFSFNIYIIQVRSDCSNVVIITDFDPYSCDISKNEYYSESVADNCIPGCVTKFGKEGSDYCSEDSECAPGLKCGEETNNCEEDPASETRCFYKNPTLSWTPSCLPDGSFAPKQCKGEAQNGRCYCYSKAGTRIFGEEWSNRAQNMTCACSRQRSELEKSRTDVTLHCDSMGNYEPLQCDSGSCWCSDTKTGDVVAAVVPEEMMTILPCYNRTLVGSQYLRQCESQLLAQNKIKFEFSTHGTNNIMLPYLQCDYDGAYGRLKVQKGLVYCAWRDNTNIFSYASSQSKMKEVNCNCARDSKLYELVGKELTKMCTGNGNYELIQHVDDKFSYCIDYDGFLTFGPAEDLKAEDCLQYLP